MVGCRAQWAQDRPKRRDVNGRARSDRVGTSRVKLFKRVRRVAGEHHVSARIVDADDGDVARRVPGGIDGDDALVIAERSASGKCPERPAVEGKGLRSESGRERLAE